MKGANLRLIRIVVLIAGWMAFTSASAGEADVVDVIVECHPECDFHVTLKHADEGWKHYANKWDVVSPDGKVLGTRVLYHPHVQEQPFTRSLSDIEIPDGITEVIVRGHDLLHQYGGKEIKVKLPAR